MTGYFVYRIYAQPTDARDDPNAIDLGTYVFSASDDDLVLANSQINVNMSTLAENLGGASNEYNAIFVVPPSTVDDTLVNYKYSLLLTVSPHVVFRNYKNAWSGSYYLKLVHEASGYYAISIATGADIYSFNLYDNEGNSSGFAMNTITGSTSHGAPLPTTDARLPFWKASFNSDNQITGITKMAWVQYGTSSLTQMGYRCKQTTYWSTNTARWFNVVMGLTPPTPPGGEDPYEDIPESEPGAGDGTFDFSTADPIDFPNTPTLSAVSIGFFSIWLPTDKELEKIAGYMWNINPNISTFFNKLITNPMDSILGLSIFPMTITPVEDPAELCLGLVSTGVEVHYTDTQWVTVDCGTLPVNETWGAYLDYSPYTKAELYLPYCGTHPIQIDDFMGKSISIKYYIDLVSGACVALVKNDVSVIYTFIGTCSAQIPVTQTQFADVVKSVVSLAANVGTMIATHGAYAAKEGTKQAVSAAVKAGTSISQGASVVENVMGMKPSIERSGAIGANAALMAPQKPYLILTRPNQARASRQNELMGYPAFITYPLEDLTGYTEVEYIHLHNIPCTDGELDEIEAILKSGVIF